MNKLFDQYLPPEEDVSWDNNMADLDSFDEIYSEGVSHDYDDDRETEVFDTSSSISDYEPDSTTHLPKEIKLPQDKTDSHSFIEENTGYEFVCSNSQVANLYSLNCFLVVIISHVMLSSHLFSSIWGGGRGASCPSTKNAWQNGLQIGIIIIILCPPQICEWFLYTAEYCVVFFCNA